MKYMLEEMVTDENEMGLKLKVENTKINGNEQLEGGKIKIRKNGIRNGDLF